MSAETESTRPTPKAFISYSWDNDPHKDWVAALATRLRADGVDVTLDQWGLQLGDQLPEFMERSIRENDFVLLICTPTYADRSNRRIGGVGYEGDIMTAEVFTKRNQRKFIPVLRSGDRDSAAPTWLAGKYGVDLRGNPYSEKQYADLFHTLHGTRPVAPPVIPRPRAASAPAATTTPPPFSFDPIRLMHVIVDEVSMPLMDGSRGSALYRVPFQLSRRPSPEWARTFVHGWNHPPSFTMRHRPGTAIVEGHRIILNRTTLEEVADVHRDTLLLVVNETNRIVEEHERQTFEREQAQRKANEEHERRVREAAKKIQF